MLHTITKRLKICIDINIEVREVDHYTWIINSAIFNLLYSNKVENLISGDIS